MLFLNNKRRRYATLLDFYLRLYALALSAPVPCDCIWNMRYVRNLKHHPSVANVPCSTGSASPRKNTRTCAELTGNHERQYNLTRWHQSEWVITMLRYSDFRHRYKTSRALVKGSGTWPIAANLFVIYKAQDNCSGQENVTQTKCEIASYRCDLSVLLTRIGTIQVYDCFSASQPITYATFGFPLDLSFLRPPDACRRPYKTPLYFFDTHTVVSQTAN